jgi:hypothetical protein
MNREISVEKIVGRWTGSADTGLMQRCKEAWDKPLMELSDLMVATLLNQKIAVPRILIEAEYRLANTDRDDSELFENQLQEAVTRAKASAI